MRANNSLISIKVKIHYTLIKFVALVLLVFASSCAKEQSVEQEINSGDAVLSFKIGDESATRANVEDETVVNSLYAFLSYRAADGVTTKFEKITEGEKIKTISHTLHTGAYLPNSSATLFVIANAENSLGNILTQDELESALEPKKTCVIGDDGTIIIERGLVAASKINLTLTPGSVSANEGAQGVNNSTIFLKRLSGRLYVASSTGKQEDIVGYRVKLENVSSSSTYFTNEGSGSTEFGEYVITGNVDGQYSVNGKETEAIGYFYPSSNVKVTVSHPKIPNKSVVQYISIKPNANSSITITPYVYDPNYPKEVVDAGLEIYTVFYSGTEANSVRIPCLVTAKDGSLLTFCEIRHDTWKDKSYTDIAVKRSIDNGKTWSATINITGSINKSGAYAFMDPTAVVDVKDSGRVFMFCVRRTRAFSNDVTYNAAYMFTSEDHGATWDSGKAVDKDIVGAGLYSGGPGPASGIQLQKGAYAGRMIFPMRQSTGSGSLGAAIYSDNGGRTWGILSSSLNAGEAQIAEVAENQLYYNVRRGDGARYFSSSTNSGVAWTYRQLDPILPAFENGCQASVLGNADNVLFYCGPKGGVKSETHDNRFELTLYRSFNGGVSWENTQLLYNLASGYSDMTILNDGRLAIVFECGPEKGFAYATIRPAGWVQVQLLILPKEVFQQGYWFNRN